VSQPVSRALRRGAAVKRALSPSSFTDASCSGATTTDLTQPQSPRAACRPLRPSSMRSGPQDALVTVGIGGNDAGLIGVAEECAKLDAAWVNGIVSTSLAFPLHPNQAGEANMAKQVEGNL
jgi:hypothetical protein